MDDRGEILNLLARYCHLVDAHRLEEVGALFLPRGTMQFAKGIIETGGAAIASRLDAVHRGMTRHLISGSDISIADSTASGTTDFLAIRRDPEDGPISISSTGSYEDTFAKDDTGQWRLNSRVIHILGAPLTSIAAP
jgi:hypothetical protein